MVGFQFFRDFIVTNESAKSSALQWVVCFFEGLNFTNDKFAELTYLDKTNYSIAGILKTVQGGPNIPLLSPFRICPDPYPRPAFALYPLVTYFF